MSGQNKLAEQAFYDELFKKRKRFDQFQKEIYQQVAAEARKRTTGKTALDIGCGSGTQSFCLMDEGFSVISADLSFQATQVTKKSALNEGRSLLIINADVEYLPFPTASVDACICSLFLHHFHRLDGVAAELQRVVRPGGVVVATDANAHNPFIWLFFNVIHRIYPITGVTQNQRALRSQEIKDVFSGFGFGDFYFDSFSTNLKRDWLGDSFAFSLNFYARAFLMKVSNTLLPRLSQGNGLLSVFHRLPETPK